jgi:hypothetical protein
MTNQNGPSRQEWASRKYWFFAGLACGVFVLPLVLLAVFFVGSGLAARSVYSDRDATLATAIREATTLAGGAPLGDTLPSPADDTMVVEVVHTVGVR